MEEYTSTSVNSTPRASASASTAARAVDHSRAKAKSKAVPAIQPPSSLHDIILDYITTNAYLSTAQCLSSHNPDHDHNIDSPTRRDKRPLPLDGDIVMDTSSPPDSPAPTSGRARRLDTCALESIERRHSIINHILNGAIKKGIDAINTYYPLVLEPTTPPEASGSGAGGGSVPRRTSMFAKINDSPGSGNGMSSNGNGTSAGYGNENGNGNGNGNGSGSGSRRYGTGSMPPWQFVSHSEPRGGGYQNGHGHGHGHGNAQNHDTGPGLILSEGYIDRGDVTTIDQAATRFKPFPTSNTIDHSIPTFPDSSHPSHLLLNLHIQEFIESFRHLGLGLASPSSSMSSSLTASMSMSMSMGSAGGETLTHALTAASGLHAEAGKLDPSDRAVYVREITEAGALFAYTDPEQSPVGGFLKQERRIALADQVNKAILRSEGMPDQSALEHIARRTTALYNVLDAKGIDSIPQPGTEGSPQGQLARWWKVQARSQGFTLHDFVSQGWS